MATDTDRHEMERILQGESIGHLALAAGDELYLVPLNYTYLEGRILFHCGLEGRKLDLIRRSPSVCFEVSRQTSPPVPHAGDACDAPFESVICWGEARIIDDVAERQAILNEFQARYDTPAKTREPIPLERTANCGAVEITVTRMTGRRCAGEEKTSWEWEA
jgi:nitroimidazol reductase NimA-like FMN-containing flavoprotein (pyridoxamine 5'-phosphate oxidase superfamily)